MNKSLKSYGKLDPQESLDGKRGKQTVVDQIESLGGDICVLYSLELMVGVSVGVSEMRVMVGVRVDVVGVIYN